LLGLITGEVGVGKTVAVRAAIGPDLDGRDSIGPGAIAQLAEVVEAPRPNGAILGERQGDVLSIATSSATRPQQPQRTGVRSTSATTPWRHSALQILCAGGARTNGS